MNCSPAVDWEDLIYTIAVEAWMTSGQRSQPFHTGLCWGITLIPLPHQFTSFACADTPTFPNAVLIWVLHLKAMGFTTQWEAKLYYELGEDLVRLAWNVFTVGAISVWWPLFTAWLSSCLLYAWISCAPTNWITLAQCYIDYQWPHRHNITTNCNTQQLKMLIDFCHRKW